MITLRHLRPEDRFRLRRWLVDPALPSWWGPRGAVEAEMAMALESASSLCFVLMRTDEAEPIGYAHAVDIALWPGDMPPDLPPATFDIDIFVGPPDRRAADTSAALRLLVAEVFATTFAMACCALISIRNEAAARAYEKAGFTWQTIWHDRVSGPCWVMQVERPR